MVKITNPPKSKLLNLHEAVETLAQVIKQQISIGYISPYPYNQIFEVAEALKKTENMPENEDNMSQNQDISNNVLHMEDYRYLRGGEDAT